MSTVTMTQWIHTVPSHLSHASAVLLPSILFLSAASQQKEVAKKIPSMLPLLSSPFAHFFLPSVLFFTYRPYSLENTYSAQMFISAHLSSETVAGIVSAAKVRGDPGHHPGLNTRCAQSQGLDRAGGFRWR